MLLLVDTRCGRMPTPTMYCCRRCLLERDNDATLSTSYQLFIELLRSLKTRLKEASRFRVGSSRHDDGEPSALCKGLTFRVPSPEGWTISLERR